MKTPSRKPSDTIPPDREAELMARIITLQAQDRALTAELLELEKQGSGEPDQEAVDIDTEAYGVLTGEPVSHSLPQAPIRNLKAVWHERSVTRRAIEIGLQLHQRERADKQLSRLIAKMDDWRALVRKTAVAVL